MDLTSISFDDLLMATKKWTSSDWENAANKLSPEQITDLASSIKDQNHLISFVKGMKEPREIEFFSNQLSYAQLNSLLDTITHDKLLPLLVGMKPEVFKELMANATQKQLDLLKKEAITEPLQYQIQTLANLLDNEVTAINKMTIQSEQGISTIDLKEFSLADLSMIKDLFYALSKRSQVLLKILSNVLTIAWHTNRPDLLAQLGHAKEMCQKNLVYGIGCEQSLDHPSTGLWELLKTRLSSVFGNTNYDEKALKDEDPAMEALVKFSIWYLKDYWEVGLLPEIQFETQLELDPNKYSEKEILEYREKLFTLVQLNLAKLKLFTVADFKSAGIFSRKSFIEYVVAQTLV